MTDAVTGRAHGALLGLAVGDALGHPAEVHRSVRTPWVRGRLWAAGAELDAERVSRPLLPFSPGLSHTAPLVPTDDAEEAGAAALTVLTATDDASLFAGWLRHHAGEDVWLGIAARSAVRNAAAGLVPPQTGTDNPAADDDAAVPSGVVCGLAHPGDAHAASALARRYARITHAGDGVDAAAAMAALTARLLIGEPLRDAVEAGRAQVAAGSWLAAGFDTTLRIADTADDGFAAVPALIRALSPRLYSHASTAAETLPLAVAVALLGDAEPSRAIPLSLTIARKADSVPAFVGALCGATRGRAAFGSEWDALDLLHGVLLPTVAGVRLSTLARRLLTHDTPPALTEDASP